MPGEGCFVRHGYACENRFLTDGNSAGEEDSEGTSAGVYHLWYRIALPDGERAWVQAALPSPEERGADGRPSAVRLVFIPAALAADG